ncbi:MULTISPECIES: hypothetical protein [Subtercola]|uniref:hypothetical protein n=1 Tax=Subtercola TaxID=120212 RepID=UPI001396B370|nr:MULTISPECIES: hypothetical protein [Subtercola]MEA9983930.1 hypothetical protein [Subtercola sp. RTI3]
MSDSNEKPNLGTDGTIPNTDDGLAVGHDPEGSHFNPEEDASAGVTPMAASRTGEGSYTDTEGDDREDRPAEADGSYTESDAEAGSSSGLVSE